MLFQSKTASAWGLDIGDLSLKLVSLIPKDRSFAIHNAHTVKVPSGYFDNGKIVNEDGVSNLLRTLITTAQGPKIKSKFIHSCLPETQTFIKLITIPEMTDKEIPEAVRWASEHHIPFPIEEMYFDWQVISHDAAQKQIYVLIGAVPKEISDAYTRVIKRADLTPLSLEVEAIAIARALIDEKHVESHKEAIAIIDIGATRSSLIIYAYQTIQFTTILPFAGHDVTQAISSKLSLSMEQAEKAKIICGIDAHTCQGALRIILEDKLDKLTKKIKTSFAFYKEEFEHHLPIKHMLLCGGGAHFKGIDAYLSEQFAIPVEIGNPEKFLTSLSSFSSTIDALSYTTAIGLALKAYEAG